MHTNTVSEGSSEIAMIASSIDLHLSIIRVVGMLRRELAHHVSIIRVVRMLRPELACVFTLGRAT